MSIAKKLLIPLAALVIGMVTIFAVSWQGLARLERLSDFMADNVTPSIGILANVGHEIIDMEAAVRRNAFARTDEERADLVKKFNVARDNATRMLQQYEDSLVADSTDARDLRDTRAALNAFVSYFALPVLFFGTLARTPVAAVLDPDVFVVGGGVSEAGDLLLTSARQTLTDKLIGQHNRPAPQVKIAELGNSAGLVGAADLARLR